MPKAPKAPEKKLKLRFCGQDYNASAWEAPKAPKKIEILRFGGTQLRYLRLRGAEGAGKKYEMSAFWGHKHKAKLFPKR